MPHPSRYAMRRRLAFLGGLDLGSLMGSPILQHSPVLLTTLVTLALLGALASGAWARPGSGPRPRADRGETAGALGAGLWAGSVRGSAAVDYLGRVPPTHLALELRLDRLRRSKTFAPLLRRVDTHLTKSLGPHGSALIRCAPGLTGQADRVIVSTPLPAVGGARLSRSAGGQAAPGSPVVILSGRFNARALARCLGGRATNAGAAAPVTALVLDNRTILLTAHAPPKDPSRLAGEASGSAKAQALPAAMSLFLRSTDADTVARLRAPQLALGGLRVPAFDELKEVRSAEALVGLPSDHLELRASLALTSNGPASALGLKLQQALTLAAMTLPTHLGLTTALQSAKVHTQGNAVSLRFLVPQADLGRLLAQLGRSSGPASTRTPASLPRGRRLAP